MRPKILGLMIGTLSLGAMLLALPASAQDQTPKPAPMNGGVVTESSDACNPCKKCRTVDPCKKCCKSDCKPACPPCIVYKGCPAPCAVDKVVTVSKPCGCTVDVAIKLPAGCERVRTHRDGDVRYEVGTYGVHIDWTDKGSKLVVRYHS